MKKTFFLPLEIVLFGYRKPASTGNHSFVVAANFTHLKLFGCGMIPYSASLKLFNFSASKLSQSHSFISSSSVYLHH